MQRKLHLLVGVGVGVGVGVALALALAAGAAADETLGTMTPPAGAGVFPESCQGAPPGEFDAFVQVGSDPSTPYTVPGAGGEITQWQTNTAGATPSTPLTFVVLRPAGGSSYTVVGLDSEMLPAPLPSSNVVTFPLSTPIAVLPGDVLGLGVDSASSGTCIWITPLGATTGIPADDELGEFEAPSAPTQGSTVSVVTGAPFAALLNVTANFVPAPEDAGVSTSAGPAGAAARQTVLLSSTVTDLGTGGGAPLTFTDDVPSGMKVDAALVGATACSTSAQTVTCTITGLTVGQRVPVNVVVTPSSAGSYTNHVSVAVPSGVTDPNTANDTASAGLSVASFLPARCVVPKLKDTTARLATTALKDLGCKVKRSKAHSKSVRKGLVVKTKPGRGAYAYQRKVKLMISSGPKKRK